MLISEARSVLGLGGGESTEEIRRAYLRAVRRHPPERDPDGFRRVREAYETLSALGDTSPALLLEDAEGDREEEREAPFKVEVFNDPADEPRPQDFPAPDPTVVHPDWMEVWSMDHDTGGRLDASDEELEEIARSESPEGPVGVLLHSLLWSIEHGEEEPAGRLLDELAGPRGGELADTLHRVPHRRQAWVGARELHGLPASFPREARAAMAEALRHDDVSRASDALHDLVMAKGKAAAAAADQLESDAPLLNQMFGDLLSGPGSERYSKATSAGLLGCLLWLIVAFSIQQFSSDPTWEERRAAQAMKRVEAQSTHAEMATAMARARFSQSCRGSGSTRGEPLCALSEEALVDLVAGRCAETTAHLDELRAFLDQTYPSEATRLEWEPFRSLTRAKDSVCTVETMTPAAPAAPAEPDPVR